MFSTESIYLLLASPFFFFHSLIELKSTQARAVLALLVLFLRFREGSGPLRFALKMRLPGFSRGKMFDCLVDTKEEKVFATPGVLLVRS